MEAGQQFEISDNQAAYLAEIAEARGERVVFRVIHQIEAEIAPLRITLCAALIKFDRFEWMIEKATELGVERIVPVETARSEKGLMEASRKRSERWARVVREGSQQARRVRAPEIAPAVRLAECLAEAADYRYFLEETTAPALLRMLPPDRTKGARAAVLLGPEGGWIDREREAAAAAGWQAVSLGPHVLRAETAAMAALAILVNAWIE